jgi:C4-dicarboxylate-specific signal transduction histidine kinase
MQAENMLKPSMMFLGWVGPPALRWRGRLIDGRKRAAVAIEIARSAETPTVTARTAQEAARRLIAAGHYDRADELGIFPAGLTEEEDRAAWCNVPAEMLKQAKRSTRTHLPRRRAKAIDEILSLLRTARARGDDRIAVADLATILGRFSDVTKNSQT